MCFSIQSQYRLGRESLTVCTHVQPWRKRIPVIQLCVVPSDSSRSVPGVLALFLAVCRMQSEEDAWVEGSVGTESQPVLVEGSTVSVSASATDCEQTRPRLHIYRCTPRQHP